MEEWKPIPGYVGLYEASNLGRVRSAEGKTTKNSRSTRVWKQRIIKTSITQSNRSTKRYDERISLYKDGIRYNYLVSRLVAMTWCDGYKDNLTVNHIDGNPLNNCSENLEWVTFSKNMIHSYKSGLSKNVKPCVIKDQSGKEYHFYSMSEASRFLGKDSHYLSTALRKGTHIYSVDGDRYDFA